MSFLRKSALAVTVGGLGMSLGSPASAHRISDYYKERFHLRERARSAVGSPYRYGGTSTSGFDCSGLSRWVFLDHGDDLPRTSIDQFYLAKRDRYRRIWDRRDLKVGDLVFHKTTSARVGHVGIYIGNGKFISTTSSSGVAVRSLYDSYWGPRWVGATRIPATRSR